MFTRLFEFVAQADPATLGMMPLQDIALCRTWYGANAHTPAQAETYAFIPKAVAIWAAEQRSPESDQASRPLTEARRTQWLLRDLIDQVQRDGVRSLAWDEAAFLEHAYELTECAADPRRFERVHGLLAPHIAALRSAKERLAPARALPALLRRLTVVTQDDIEQARPREIRFFCGIDMPSLGPVLTVQGHLKVLGSIPENCTVVVEDGSCSVEGFVLGKAAASRHCDVRENIAGMVVVRQGDIRSRNIVDRAYVVSKRGRVICRQVQNPALVFGGSEIHVKGPALLGQLLAPRITIDGEARGGVYQAIRQIEAEQFSHTSSSEARIVLRRELSCVDYGEELSVDAVRLVWRSRLLNYRAKNLRRMLKQNIDEAESLATSTIYYLCTQGDMQKHVERLQAAERRIAVLMRLMQGLQTLAVAAEDRLGADSTLSRSRPVASGAEQEREELSEEAAGGASYIEVARELKMLASEDTRDGDLDAAVEEMNQIRQKLAQQMKDRKLLSLLLTRVRARLDDYVLEIRELTDAIARHRAEFAAVLEQLPRYPEGDRPKTMLELLRRVRSGVQTGKGDPAFGARVNSSFVQMMWRKIENRLRLSRQYRETIQRLEEELRRISGELHKKHQVMMLENDDNPEEAARVCGRFEQGVVIMTDPYLLNESEPPPRSIFYTPNTKDAVHIYFRSAAGAVVRQT